MLPKLAAALSLAFVIAACDKGPTAASKQEQAVAAAPVPAPAPGASTATPTETPTETAPSAAAAIPEGKTFGAGVTLTEIVAIDAILADPAAYQGKTVRVEGMITDVCPKRGCWFDLAGTEPGKKLKFKVTDGEMVFPVDAKGQWASAQGVVSVRELSLEESKQHAEYQAKEYGIPYDPASITEPTKLVRLDGTGAVFRDKK